MSLSNPTLSNPKFGNNQIAGILAILLLISGGVELTVYTLQLEHSCPPLLQEWWPNNCAPQCSPLVAEVPQPQPIPTTSDKSKSNESKNCNDAKKPSNPIAEKPIQKPENPEPINEPTPEPKPPIDPKEIAAIAAGSIAIAALVLLGTPLVGAAGAGIGIWLVARTLIDLNN